ncbi:MAG: hypothetical protein PHD37_12880 [Gallionellaceae bacterium]|nr:hypothetical protein [Gallionellaceae bacterium]
MSYLLHPSGSLPYHLRAWRRRHTLWAPFHTTVRRWLTGWRPEAKHLVLVGPSGGYALTAQFLERFERISVLEPDPLACWLLRRQFPGCAFEWRESGYLAQPGGFARLAATFPDAALLFCNLLGQELQGQPTDFDRGAWLAELEPALAGRLWASWHDLVSSTRAPEGPAPEPLEQAIPLDELLARVWRGGDLEITDHETAGLCPSAPRRYALWHLAPRGHHLIEWLDSSVHPRS